MNPTASQEYQAVVYLVDFGFTAVDRLNMAESQ
jgi:hypothetical protein